MDGQRRHRPVVADVAMVDAVKEDVAEADTVVDRAIVSVVVRAATRLVADRHRGLAPVQSVSVVAAANISPSHSANHNSHLRVRLLS